MRKDEELVKKMEEEGQKMLTPEMGEKLAKEIGAIAYLETSARENEGVHAIFEKAMEYYFSQKKKDPKKGFKKCVIL